LRGTFCLLIERIIRRENGSFAALRKTPGDAVSPTNMIFAQSPRGIGYSAIRRLGLY
jgi:hypothetical protein